MIRILSILLILGLGGCATVPDSIKVALEKEGAAIRAVESDYNASVSRYHAELINQIDGRLDYIYKCEVEKSEILGKKIKASDILRLDEQRKNQRVILIRQADQNKEKYLNNKNLLILKSLHEKVLQYAESGNFTASGFATLLTELDAEIDKIKEDKK